MVNFDKFLASFITEMKKYTPITSYNIPACIKKALEDQGLEYRDGEIVKTQDIIAIESEDERIRKALIEYFSEQCDMSDWNGVYGYQVLAWLEKQGEHANFRNKIQIGDKVTRNKDGVLVNLSQLNRVAKKDEKQGEQNHSEQDLEMVAKPKFNIGDWITSNEPYINNDYRLCKVVGISDGCYTIQTINGLKGYNTFKGWESEYHLWSIKDAKDGDVLYIYSFESDCVFLYQNTYEIEPNRNVAVAYCCIDVYANKIEFGIQGPDCIDVRNIKPATKEQRDLLFQKMKESGYEWNDENKKLKKIGQKPDNEVKPFDEYAGFTDFESTLADICIGWIGKEMGWKQYVKENAAVLLRIAIEKFNSVQDTPFEQKSAWSEEDEEMLKSIMATCELAEQERDSSPARHLLEMQLNWLRNLKERYTWKPSDEQMEALANALSLAKNCGEESAFDLRTLYEQLKKLKGE